LRGAQTTAISCLAELPVRTEDRRARLAKPDGRSSGLSIVDCIEAGHGKEAAALGLAFYVVDSSEAAKTASLRDAAVRLEQFTGNRPISKASA